MCRRLVMIFMICYYKSLRSLLSRDFATLLTLRLTTEASAQAGLNQNWFHLKSALELMLPMIGDRIYIFYYFYLNPRFLV